MPLKSDRGQSKLITINVTIHDKTIGEINNFNFLSKLIFVVTFFVLKKKWANFFYQLILL